MGGETAIDFTVTYPNCVKQLVLINSVGYSESFPIGQILFPPIDFFAMEWWRFLKLQTLANAKADRDRDAAYLDALLCTILPLEMPGWYESILTFTKTGGYSLTEEQIAQIDKPTLILWGELDKDNFLAKGNAEKFNKAIAHLWLRWFTASRELILTPSEEAEAAQARVTQAEERAERLAAKLRELNIDPDELE